MSTAGSQPRSGDRRRVTLRRLPKAVKIRYLAPIIVGKVSSSSAMPRPSKTRHAPVDGSGNSPPGPVLDLSSHIPSKVAIFANRLQRSASRFYRTRYGIAAVEWRLMMFIGHAVETRANRICRETDLDKGAVSRALAVLQKMGIVSIEEDGSDSRRNNIALTAKGRALHDEMVPIALDRQSELVADLTQAEIETFTRLIDRLQAKIADGEPGLDDVPPKPLPAVPQRAMPAQRRQEPSSRRRSPREGEDGHRGGPPGAARRPVPLSSRKP